MRRMCLMGLNNEQAHGYLVWRSAFLHPCPINNNFELIGGFIAPVDPMSYSLTPWRWPFSDPDSTLWLFIDPLAGPIDPWGSISTTLRTNGLEWWGCSPSVPVDNLSLAAGQTQFLHDMAGRSNFPPTIPFILLFMMLIVLANLCHFNQIYYFKKTCAGLELGIEAAIHAVRKSFDEDNSECLLLVDADNAFNKLNRKVSLENIKRLYSPVYTYLYNSYNTPAMLYLENGDHILSQEGVTQGDNAAMAMYALSTRPLIQALSKKTANDEVKQVWYADDSSAVGSLAGVKKWWEYLQANGPDFGYCLNQQRQSS